MDLEKKEKLIRRIVEERGKDALPTLLRLLGDEDPEVREIVSEAFRLLGDDAREFLYAELLKRWRKGIEKNDVTLLYIVDILGDLGEKRMEKILLDMLSKYDVEEALLVIYEALAKIGKGEKFLPYLEYLLFEDSYRKELCEQVAMVLANIDSEKSVDLLLRALDDDTFSKKNKEFFLKAIFLLITRNPSFVRYIVKKGREDVMDKIRKLGDTT